MKCRFLTLIIAASAAIACSSCTAISRSTVTEYDAEGRIVKVIETRESIAKTLAADLSNKTVVVTTDGWGAAISVASEVTKGLTPAFDLKAGKFSGTYISALKDADCSGIAEIITATGGTFSIGAAGIVDTDTPASAVKPSGE